MLKAFRPVSTALRYVSRFPVTFRSSKFALLSLPRLRIPSYYSSSRQFSSHVDKKFCELLTEEIKQEKENSVEYGPPRGFFVSRQEGTEVHLEKKFPDGVIVTVELDLAGSIAPEETDESETVEKNEVPSSLQARPDMKLRLSKPSGKCVLFHCSLPSKLEEQSEGITDNTNMPTFSVDMVEMGDLPGYFVYSDLFDDDMYDYTMRLLTERGIDYDFQKQLQDFATSEEHKLYRAFLSEFKSYCKD